MIGIRGKGRGPAFWKGNAPFRSGGRKSSRPGAPLGCRDRFSHQGDVGLGRDGTLSRVIGPDHDRGIEIAHPNGIGVSGRAAISRARRASDPCGNQRPSSTQDISEHLFKYLTSQFHGCVG